MALTKEDLKKQQITTVERQSRGPADITLSEEQYENEGYTHGIDFYLPDRSVFPGLRPGVLFFFGGGFALGCRHAFRENCKILAQHGIVCATADYRISTVHDSTAADSFRDGAAAWNYFRSRAGEFSMDEEKLFIAGGSAGGMIAWMCGLLSGVRPYGLVLFNPGVIDHDPDCNDITNIAGTEVDGVPVLNTKSFSGDLPKMLIMHGEKDHIVFARSIEKMVEFGRENGGDIQLIMYPGMDHGFFNFNRSRPHFYITTGEMMKFIDEAR